MEKIVKNKLLALILLSFFIALSSAFWTSAIITRKEEQRHVQFGWPLEYVEQNQEQLDPPYPWELKLGIPQEYPSTILWGALLIDTGFFSIVLLLIFIALYGAFPTHRRWLDFVKFKYVLAIPIVLIVLFILVVNLQSSTQLPN